MEIVNKKEIIKKKKICLGPIVNFENYLSSDWWKKIFNSLYLKTDADVVENAKNTIEDVDNIIKFTSINFDSKILDICCGQGRHVLELAQRGYKNISGMDRSQYLIKIAKKRAFLKGFSNLNFYEGDARKIRHSSGSLDAVTMLGNSFGYFEHQNDDLAVLNEVNRILASKGSLLLDLSNGEWLMQNFQKRSWEWIDKSLLVCRERVLSESNRLISREVIINVNKGVLTDQFYAERLYSFQSIKELLEKANFENITLMENVQSSSTRNQDLGMMENRMFVLAKAPNKKINISLSTKKINCHVLLGDPSLSDPVKNDGKFNPEDLETVAILKKALSELKNYKFTFIDDHKKILTNFNSLEKPDIVLNFCDEGYNNDLNKELHIPALLEMLNIPYTGSDPKCLSLCYNKFITNSFAQSLKIKIPNETLIDQDSFSINMIDTFPLILKPSNGDGSIGITQKAVCNNMEELISYFNWLKTNLPNMPIIVQEFLPGREFSVGIIGNRENLEVLPILEVDYSKLSKDLPKLLCYESKWIPTSAYWNNIHFKKADLNEEEQRELIDSAKLLFKKLDCKDYVRFDFRTSKDGQIKLLEINPNPGWCWDGKLNIMAGFAGLTYSQLLDKILNSALERFNLKNKI
jgi:D-alanine-D-alanine ligase